MGSQGEQASHEVSLDLHSDEVASPPSANDPAHSDQDVEPVFCWDNAFVQYDLESAYQAETCRPRLSSASRVLQGAFFVFACTMIVWLAFNLLNTDAGGNDTAVFKAMTKVFLPIGDSDAVARPVLLD